METIITIWQKYIDYVMDYIREDTNEPAMVKAFLDKFVPNTKELFGFVAKSYKKEFKDFESGFTSFTDELKSKSPEKMDSDVLLDKMAIEYLKRLNEDFPYNPAISDYIDLAGQTLYLLSNQVWWFNYLASWDDDEEFKQLDSSEVMAIMDGCGNDEDYYFKRIDLHGKAYLVDNSQNVFRYHKNIDGFVVDTKINTIAFKTSEEPIKLSKEEASKLKFFKRGKKVAIKKDKCYLHKSNDGFELFFKRNDGTFAALEFGHNPFKEIETFSKAISLSVATKEKALGDELDVEIIFESPSTGQTILTIYSEMYSLDRKNKRFELKKYSENDDAIKILHKNIEKDVSIEERLVYGVVAEPNVYDAHNEWMKGLTIKEAAHKWSANYRKIGFMHYDLLNEKAVEVVETYLAPQDFTYDGSDTVVKKGSWIVVTRINEEKIWQLIKAGKMTGYSLGGLGATIREES